MRYDEIKIGDMAEVEHSITIDDINKFVDLSGDDNRLHTDPKFAATTEFKTPVVHGMIGMSFISTLIGTKLPGDGALWYYHEIEFLLPVRIEDTIIARAIVTKKNDVEQIIELDIKIFNQFKQIVTKGVCKVKVANPVELNTEEVFDQVGQKTAVLIGASGGIGSATAKKFYKQGYNVVITYNKNIKKGEELKKFLEDSENGNGQIKLAKCDITSEKSVIELMELCKRFFGQIDTIVSFASGKFMKTDFTLVTSHDLLEHFNINVCSALNITQSFLEVMRKNFISSFIFITSESVDKPLLGFMSYITGKSALEGFARSAALELARFKVRVNLVSPSMVDTDLTADIPIKAKLLTKATTPIGRLAKPEDVANAIYFLASEDGAYMTGETIRVVGGRVML
jgi:3-oxoacyl-[acyl-carrier protein] reductase